MRYDSAQSLCDYLKQLECCSVVSGWSQEEASSFLATGLRGEMQKVLNGMSDSDCRNYTKLVDKLELWFGVEKQHESHQVCLSNRRQLGNRTFKALAADIWSMSSLAYQDLSPDTLERFAIQHLRIKLKLHRDKPCSLEEALSLACELEVFHLLDGDGQRTSPKVRSVDEVDKEPDLFKAQLDMVHSNIQVQQQCQETQQVAL